MEVHNPIRLILDRHQHEGAGVLVDFKRGDLVNARVLRLASDQRAVLDFGFFQASSRIPEPVQAGQILHLKVVSIGPPIHLLLLAHPSDEIMTPWPQMDLAGQISIAARNDLLKVLATLVDSRQTDLRAVDRQALQQMLIRIKTLLQPLSLDSSVEQLMQRLSSGVEKSGMLWENTIYRALLGNEDGTLSLDGQTDPSSMPSTAKPGTLQANPSQNPGEEMLGRVLVGQDLKGQLLLLRAILDRTTEKTLPPAGLQPKQIRMLKKVSGQLLEHIVRQQDHLIQRNLHSRNFQVITHWFPLTNQKAPLRLKFYYPKNNQSRDGHSPWQICLLLDLDRLGQVRTDLIMMDGRLLINVSVVDQPVKELIDAHKSILVGRLQRIFSQVSATVHVAREKIEAFEAEDNHVIEKGSVDIQV